MVGVVARKHEVEGAGPETWHHQRTASVEGVHLAADFESAGDDAERASAAKGLEIEVVNVGRASPVEVVRQGQQLTAHVRTERLL